MRAQARQEVEGAQRRGPRMLAKGRPLADHRAAQSPKRRLKFSLGHRSEPEVSPNETAARETIVKIEGPMKADDDVHSRMADDGALMGAEDGRLKFWSYKETGIKSRPIKLIEHPIENIERKIILTYILGFLFKFMAIISGPLIVLIALILQVPFVFSRRFGWFMLNLLLDARIKTWSNERIAKRLSAANQSQAQSEPANNGPIGESALEPALRRQIYWKWNPLNHLESYWFKEKLVNCVILVIDRKSPERRPATNKRPANSQVDDRSDDEITIERSVAGLRRLVRDEILSRPKYRKFLCRVKSFGPAPFQSYYWQYLGLSSEDQGEEEDETDDLLPMGDQRISSKANDPRETGGLESGSRMVSGSSASLASSTADRFSISTRRSDVLWPGGQDATSSETQELGGGGGQQLSLRRHVFIERQFKLSHYISGSQSSQGPSNGSRANSRLAERSAVTKYAHKLLSTDLIAPMGPLWEMRLLPATSSRRLYLIFRCHQSLADGQALAALLTEHLARPPSGQLGGPEVEPAAVRRHNNGHNPANDLEPQAREPNVEAAEADAAAGSEIHDQGDEEDERQLKPIRQKPSFVKRVAKSSSLRSSILVGPLTVLLWIVWSLTRRKNNHLNRWHSRLQLNGSRKQRPLDHERRLYMSHYNLTKFYQIKQMTRGTFSDLILCALAGALRDYLRRFNGVPNPPNLNVSLAVDMQQASRCTSLAKGWHEPAPQVNWTSVNVPLPTSVEGTVPRLWELRGTMEELRSSADPWVMAGLQRLLFNLLPCGLYRWLVNCIALRNSSALVSHLRGPNSMVETWCVDLLQRALLEAQAPSRTLHVDLAKLEAGQQGNPLVCGGGHRKGTARTDHRLSLRLLGQLEAVYYCVKPPSADVPLSFNCITYHNKLYICALSSSVLVEDSKLLIRLFFRQLDQLLHSVAKRRSLVTIIRKPAEELARDELTDEPAGQSSADESSDEQRARHEPEEELRRSLCSATPTRPLATRDDLEANYAAQCEQCGRSLACTCRRRKSMFSFEMRQQRLISLLNPINLMSTSRSSGQLPGSEPHGEPNECSCGQRLLEQLDEDAASQRRESSSRPASVDHPPRLKINLRCARCRLQAGHSSQSSTISAPPTQVPAHDPLAPSPDHQAAPNRAYSKSETDLMPAGSDSQQAPSEPKLDSWSALGCLAKRRRGSSQGSMLCRSGGHLEATGAPTQRRFRDGHQFTCSTRNTSARSGPLTDASMAGVSSSRPYGSSRRSRRRRQSVATTTGHQSTHWQVVVKDKVNADASLRCQLESSSSMFSGHRARRFSVIGGQRWSSLIPFGLMQEQSFPKLFWPDGEAHL